jgi:DNA processing protein
MFELDALPPDDRHVAPVDVGNSGQAESVYPGVMPAAPPLTEHSALVALLRGLPKGSHWSEVTERLLECGSAATMWQHVDAGALLPDPQRADALAEAAKDLADWQANGWRFLSITDAAYPARLRDIHQAPPFLFASGQILADDPAIAVVGSRKASEAGIAMATEVANALSVEGITVLSGLAEGIDTAAHRAALSRDGRTVAIIGTGLAQSYPASNRDLQEAIANDGLLLSQFWPHGATQRHNFLMRNAVMSGYGRATVVVEAGEQSGARAQARMAVEHGRPVILTDRVLRSNEWAKRLEGRPGVHIAASLKQVMMHVHEVLAQEQDVDALLNEVSSTS